MTKIELANLVLKKLRIIDAEETPEAADHQEVEDAYDSLYVELQNDELVSWTSTADIPLWAENSIADILAFRLRGTFGVKEGAQEMMISSEAGYRNLRKQLSARPVNNPTYYY